MSRRTSALLLAAALLGTGACGAVRGSEALQESPAASQISATEVIAATPSATPAPSPSENPPPFTSKITKVTRDQVRHSWREGCPVGLDDLRMVTMTYWGFDQKPHTGQMVLNASVAEPVASVFHRLYDYRYPIRQMKPVDVYKGDDYASIDADNTSAFNCRAATGSTHWSQHAYGYAVDLNPLENPYVEADGSNAHRNADAYVKRPLKKPGVINAGDRVVRAFADIGWGWGGDWSGIKDYQHFSKSGR
ncbi:M15 family metallopeptidase [Acrocarpospora catenulata]|uniref:M15 family metallopeptidase n=1 Tax=Acrocarpospora catenulata TaxID=2836182 RepID=UPI001BD95A7D|nr:M15 family metallopeptidase [Acrocarpospora catenulata]